MALLMFKNKKLLYLSIVYIIISYLQYQFDFTTHINQQLGELFDGEKQNQFLEPSLGLIEKILQIPIFIVKFIYRWIYAAYHPDNITLEYLISSLKNVCLKITDNMDVNNLTPQQKLQAFINGPCSPVILIPGVMASALMVEINCQELRQHEPQIFASCGWNTCESNPYDLFSSAPEKEYALWVASLFDPVSALNKDECFGNLIQLRENPKATSLKDKFISPRGIRVSWKGDTKGTKDNNTCGKEAVVQLADHSIGRFIKKFYGFKGLIAVMEAMGYQTGITYQALPYDFRKAIIYGDIDQKIKKTIESQFKFTGKKVTVLSHSYGSVRTLYAMDQFEQDFKDKYIHQWIANGSPFSGVNRLVKAYLNGDDQFVAYIGSFFGQEIYAGIQFIHQKLIAPGSTFIYDLYPKDTMTRHRDKQWMQEILKRIEYEHNIIDLHNKPENGEIPLSFLPPVHELCTHEVYEDQDGQCKTHLYDQHNHHLASIENQQFHLHQEDMEAMFNEYSHIKNLSQNFLEAQLNVLHNLTNPGVPLINVYGSYGDVEIQYQYHSDPLSYTEQNQFYFPNVTHKSKGDLTVSTNSALLGPLKWIWEEKNQQNNSKSAKPVRLVELCSSYQTTNKISLNKNEKGENIFINSGYNGLKCQCQFSKNPEDCDHTLFLNDPFLIEFFTNQFIANSHSLYKNNKTHIENYSNEYLEKFVFECPNLH